MFFALRVLLECPEEYKAEILYFTKDSSKKVQGELLGFLYGQKSWEEDIKKCQGVPGATNQETVMGWVSSQPPEGHNLSTTA